MGWKTTWLYDNWLNYARQRRRCPATPLQDITRLKRSSSVKGGHLPNKWCKRKINPPWEYRFVRCEHSASKSRLFDTISPPRRYSAVRGANTFRECAPTSATRSASPCFNARRSTAFGFAPAADRVHFHAREIGERLKHEREAARSFSPTNSCSHPY